MAYIKVDVIKVDNCIQQSKTIKKKYVDLVNSDYEVLSNVDDCWTDVNSHVFVKEIKKDQLEVLNYFRDLDDVYAELETFNNNLLFLLSKFGYSNKKKLLLKFDNSKLNLCNTKLSNVIGYLNNANYVINYYLLSSEYKTKFYDIRYKLNQIKSQVVTIRDNINKFNTEISKYISLHNMNISKKKDLNLNVSNAKYSSNIVDL